MSGPKADNTEKWKDIFHHGGPRNYYPHSYVVSWYFKNVCHDLKNVLTKKILDIGCGTAPDLYLFVAEGFEYHGIDITDFCFSEIYKQASLRRSNTEKVHLKTFDPPLIPYPDESYDVVIGLESIHFNATDESMQSMVKEIYRVLKPGGYFFFTTINKKHYFVVSGHSRFISDKCIVIEDGFPEKERIGLRYYVFSDAVSIADFFKNFSCVKTGEYLLDTSDNKPDAYYLVFGKK